jgi:hypothetical protein
MLCRIGVKALIKSRYQDNHILYFLFLNHPDIKSENIHSPVRCYVFVRCSFRNHTSGGVRFRLPDRAPGALNVYGKGKSSRNIHMIMNIIIGRIKIHECGVMSIFESRNLMAYRGLFEDFQRRPYVSLHSGLISPGSPHTERDRTCLDHSRFFDRPWCWHACCTIDDVWLPVFKV